MKLTIDNLDGKGAVDYSGCVCPEGPVKIARTLNAPSLCSGLLEVNTAGLGAPVRRGRVVVSSDAGTVLFTGYLATEPEPVYAGGGVAGSVYRLAFSAVSDEWLLDKLSVPLSGAALAQGGGQVLQTLTQRVGAGVISTVGVAAGRAVGVFEARQTESWSANAGDAAAAAYAAYRVVGGALSLQPTGAVTHTLSDGDGTLQVAALKSSAVKELANDVTVSGEMEPTAYVTETFAGDGTTTVFDLQEAPYKARRSNTSLASGAMQLNDSFNQASFNPVVWSVTDPGSHLGLSSAGLTMNGGTGLDGQTTLVLIDPVEMGGSLVVEAGSLQLSGLSAGIVCGMYSGMVELANCFVGYNVRQSSGNTVVVGLLNGVEVGTVFTITQGHTYTLRIRLHCAEMQRVLQSYYATVEGVLTAFGGGTLAAPMQVVYELQDLGLASNTPATVLYDTAAAGTVANTPASCTFAAVNSLQLFGSMGYCRIAQTGSSWVVSTLSSGTKFTRLIGLAGEGVDCKVSATGKVTFYAGRVPVAGEIVTVLYRGRQRAAARVADAASVSTEAAGGVPGSARWLGKVVRPLARCWVDCENAARAVVSFASSRSAALAGEYLAVNSADVWPGDVLKLTTSGQTSSVIVRRVEIVDGMAAPEVLTYKMGFANDWAEGLGLKLSESVATDAFLPTSSVDVSTVSGSSVIGNLQQMTVVSVSSTAIQLDMGLAPSTGGGFEVRRRDWDFGPGVDQDLVMRSSVRGFSIPREGQVERYYVRMFDGSTPPRYSQFSAAVFTDIPVS